MENIFKLSADWSELVENSEIVPFGIGRIGRRVIPCLMKEFTIPFLIDNNGDNEFVFGLEVFSLDEVTEYLKEKRIKIVVTTVVSSYENIKLELESFGFVENVNFCILERFVEEWNLRWKNKCVLSKIDTVITSRCTLKCMNCNMFVSYAAEQKDIDIDKLIRNFDVFFDNVDYVYEYTLLGGEPFLHNELPKILLYMGEKYGNRIGKINLISNGTVIPSDEIIEIMCKYHISVHISDYTCSVRYEEKIRELADRFSNAGVEYYIIPNNIWKDVIYPQNTYISDNPAKHMRLCGHSTHSVGNEKLYWCDPAFAAECFTGFQSRKDDYLDLVENKKRYTKYESSLNIFNYLLGEINERGYMSICEKCAGIGVDNTSVVKAGRQIEREKK